MQVGASRKKGSMQLGRSGKVPRRSDSGVASKRTSSSRLTRREREFQAKRAACTKAWGCEGMGFLGTSVWNSASFGCSEADEAGERDMAGAAQGRRRRAGAWGAGFSRRFTRSRAPSTPSGGTSGARSWSAARRRRRGAATASESALPARIRPNKYLQGSGEECNEDVSARHHPGPKT